jgi:hypothetical protein
MSDYFGTDEDDIIDASKLDSDVGRINPGKGNDTVTNLKSGQTVVSSPGEDTISGSNFDYAFWYAEQGVTINLKEGWSEDGFGTRDTISGVITIHGSGFGDTFYGTDNYEKFFANGGDNILNMGVGNDRISYTSSRGDSTDFTITKVGDEIHIVGPNTKDIMIGGRYIEFMGDNKIIDTQYLDRPIISKYTKLIHSFEDSTKTEVYIYAGDERGGKLAEWFPQQVFTLDINDDKIDDVILPMSFGYASGLDGRTPFIALTTSNGTLEFNNEINAKMPITTGARRGDYIKIAGSDNLSYVTVAHLTDVVANRYNPESTIPPAELNFITSISSDLTREDIFPRLPKVSYGGYEWTGGNPDDFPYGVSEHSFAVGDINGDGLDDLFFPNYQSKYAIPGEKKGSYELVQSNEGKFSINRQDLYTKLQEWPLTNSNAGEGQNLLLDATLVDVNSDGFDDLIIGFGHGSTESLIFINDKGKFSENNRISLPESFYGIDNQMHMKTMPADFDSDGDIDLAILWSPFEPFYGGNYIQIILNDGNGNYTDVTNLIPNDAYKDADTGKLDWVEPWQLIDMNNDGHIDIAGSRTADENYNNAPIVYFNDGKGRFEIAEIGSETSGKGKPYAYSDFDNDNKMEYVTFKNDAINNQTTSRLTFHLFELENELGTGPKYSSTAKDGAPGFNERYYLNENLSAKEAVDAGTHASGLEHYLAEGKDAGLKAFAPFTKVHGYSGDDTIVLREGDETAFGYAGKDTIEGGAGNDAIDGGNGVDTAIYKDSSSAYTLTANDNGTVSVVHTSPSEDFTNEGSDTLTSIEKMQFSDKTLSKTSLKYQLSETIDASENILSAHTEDVLSGTLNFNKGDNIIILDGQGKTYRGLEGDDTYFVSQLLPKNGKVSITDTEGSNTIQLPGNTYVDKSLFTKNAARLTLEDGREITISGADKFSYNVGGNITKGDKGTDLTFTEFAEVFGVYDILNSSGAQTGEISDMYII